jgi:DeoR/GlpR family transcriptional regulator of sugar metabolism
MLKQQRQDEILEQVLRRGLVSVTDLAASLNVSDITVRRDLDELDKGGYLKRIHGGAQRLTPRDPEPSILHRQFDQVMEKQAIGEAAAEFVSDGDAIALESGSTTMELARVIAKRAWQDLQVVTNSFEIASALMRVPGVRLVFVGGIVNPDELGTFGVPSEETLKRMSIGKLFIGCRGIDPEAGLTNDVQAAMEIATVRAFAAASSRVFVLADHTKFERTFLVQMLSIGEIDAIVTDSLTPERELEKLRKQVRQIVVAQADGAANPQGARSNNSRNLHAILTRA